MGRTPVRNHNSGDIAEPREARVDVTNAAAERHHEEFQHFIEECALAVEIEVERAACDVGRRDHVGNGRAVIALLGEDCARGFEDAVAPPFFSHRVRCSRGGRDDRRVGPLD